MVEDMESRIRERAYHLWVREGRQHGRDMAHWLEAERSIAAEPQPVRRPRRKADGGAKSGTRPRKQPGSPASGQ